MKRKEKERKRSKSSDGGQVAGMGDVMECLEELKTFSVKSADRMTSLEQRFTDLRRQSGGFDMDPKNHTTDGFCSTRFCPRLGIRSSGG